MSRGTSNIQLKVLNKIKEKGCLTIFEVAKIYHKEKMPDDEDSIIPMGSLWREVREISNINSIYRMMKSLENRGEVGTLLHKRPKEWYYIEYDDETIGIPNVKHGYFRLLIITNGIARIRTKGLIFSFDKGSFK